MRLYQGAGIRTPDLLPPKQAPYQTWLHLVGRLVCSLSGLNRLRPQIVWEGSAFTSEARNHRELSGYRLAADCHPQRPRTRCWIPQIGMRGFEPPTPRPPGECANQTAPHSENHPKAVKLFLKATAEEPEEKDDYYDQYHDP